MTHYISVVPCLPRLKLAESEQQSTEEHREAKYLNGK